MPPAKLPDEQTIALNFTPSGKVRGIYKDELVPLYESLGKVSVHRASNVEWEEISGFKGWTVRAAHDPELAIRTHPWENRLHVSKEGGVVVFPTRELALEREVYFFWDLLPTEK